MESKQPATRGDEAKAIAESLYKQNMEISGKNKTLSLLSKLYSISILTLSSQNLALQVCKVVQTDLSFEWVGVLLFDSEKQQLSPLGFVGSDRIKKAESEHRISFGDLFVSLDTHPLLKRVIDSRTPAHSNNLSDMWGTLIADNILQKIADEGHIRSSVIFPLIIQNEVIGILVMSMNRPYESLAAYEKESAENSVNVIAVALDKALLYERLKTTNVQLQALDKARAEFISIASHQLRTPPATIKWYIGAILTGDFGALAPDMQAALERVNVTNNSQISLIDDLLNASRIERGKMEFFFELGDLDALADLTVEQLKPQAGMKKLELVYHKPSTPVVQVLLDKEKVRQVINNFIDNAIKYTKQGTINVYVEQTASDVVVKVKDSGRGVSPDVAPTLFNKYTRGKDSATAATGLGLGLYVAKVVIEQNQGKIWVESEGEGKGSTFIFSLPIKSTLQATSVVDLAEPTAEVKQ